MKSLVHSEQSEVLNNLNTPQPFPTSGESHTHTHAHKTPQQDKKERAFETKIPQVPVAVTFGLSRPGRRGLRPGRVFAGTPGFRRLGGKW